jgi:hypothetical protein
MVELQALGPLELRDARGPLESVQSQPKRAALMAYLALARPRRPHRRDEILALFWPELDDAHARNALSQAGESPVRWVIKALARAGERVAALTKEGRWGPAGTP